MTSPAANPQGLLHDLFAPDERAQLSPTLLALERLGLGLRKARRQLALDLEREADLDCDDELPSPVPMRLAADDGRARPRDAWLYASADFAIEFTRKQDQDETTWWVRMRRGTGGASLVTDGPSLPLRRHEVRWPGDRAPAWLHVLDREGRSHILDHADDAP